ncbi:hypothetical protein [Brachybacterium sacelli]|uniref:ABC transporter permease n=1 Tax=Brachybacterium sacelli TaxID=173364 RepID=UPI0031D6EB5E
MRLAMRRDRVLLVAWSMITTGIVLGGMAAAGTTYPTAQDRADRWEQLHSVPMFVLFQSRAFSDTAEALAAQQAFAGGTMCAALGAILLVARTTRGEESAGRRDLLAGTPLGRRADLAAALTLTMVTGALLAIVITCGLIAIGMPWAGSLALALITALAVWTGAGLAAIAAQLLTGVGGVVGLAFATFYVFHLIRGAGAAMEEGALWLTRVVPQGWWENLRPFADERWWTLLPALAAVTLSVVASFHLAARRDLGRSLVPTSRGREHGAWWLRSVPSLLWRLDRASLTVWALAVAVIALAIGYIGADTMSAYADTEWVRAMGTDLGVAPEDTFFTYVILVFVFPIAGHALYATLQIRREETAGTAELLLSGPLRRRTWALAHAIAGFLYPVLLLIVLGIAVGIGSGLGGGHYGADIARFTTFTVSLAPAIWVLVGITILAHSVVPRRAAAVSWSLLGIGIFTEIAVKTGLVPELLFLLVSPFAHVNPHYQATWTPYVLLPLLSVGFVAAGLLALRRRDLPA